MPKAPDPTKAAKHESKGDAHLQKGKAAKALAEYRKVLEHEPHRPGIYDKLIAARERAGGEWTRADFAESVTWAMEKQAQEHPEIRQTHARLSPEWQKATELALRVLMHEAPEAAGREVEELVAMGEIATRALIGMLIELKRAASAPANEGARTDAEEK
jgi:hypothetical protein